MALTAAFGAGIVWALAGKAIPAVFPDGGRAARLRDPIGYWNALALAADALLVLALSFAGSARAVAVRMGCAALAYAAVVAVLLAASRAGVAAAALGIVLWLWLRRDRVEAALLVLVAIVPAALVAGWAFTRPALVEDGASHADRVSDGAWFGLLLVVGAALVAAGARELARRPLPPARRRQAARFLRGLAFAVAFVTVVGLVANAGRIADEFRGEEVRNDPGRFVSLSSNNRLAWWGEARDIFEAHPLAGAGANTFEVARKRYRDLASSVTQPHSVPLQFLAGTGSSGWRSCSGSWRPPLQQPSAPCDASRGRSATRQQRSQWCSRSGSSTRSSTTTGTSSRSPARPSSPPGRSPQPDGRHVAAPSRSRPQPRERSRWPPRSRSSRPGSRSGACATSIRRSSEATSSGARCCRRARSLDPLSLAPLFARARVEEDARDEEAALAAYRRAAALQPDNPVSWYELGLYEFHLGDRCSAYVHLNRAYTLDPAGTQWTPGSELDQARAWVNDGNC